MFAKRHEEAGQETPDHRGDRLPAARTQYLVFLAMGANWALRIRSESLLTARVDIVYSLVRTRAVEYSGTAAGTRMKG